MELVWDCSTVLGTKRAWRRSEEESKESSRASLSLERTFLSSMQKSLAVLAEFTKAMAAENADWSRKIMPIDAADDCTS